MPKHIRLINARDLATELGAPVNFRQPAQEAWLQSLPIPEFFSVGTGKGGRVMVSEAVAQQIRDLGVAITSETPRRARREPTGEEAPPPEVVIDDAWRSEIEEIILEQESRIDALHRAVEAMHATYTELVRKVDPKANLPGPPPLPPKFRYKVVIVGLPGKAVQRIRDMFPQVQIVHFGGSDQKHRGGKPPGLPKNPDLVLYMSNYVGHQAGDIVEKLYGREQVSKLSGGHSSAESAISVWLAQKQQHEQETDA